MNPIILGIESSCDETSAAIWHNGKILSNIIATQEVHKKWGGVVPELASRAHQQNIVPVVDQAIKKAKVSKERIDGVAFTRGPGLIGALLVGSSFAKAFALARNIHCIEVNHMQAHVQAHFIEEPKPQFPFLCLTVSGGHTQLVRMESHTQMKVIGETLDDAAGEAFDKSAKIIGLPYPGGPLIDKYAKEGNPKAFEFNHPSISGLDYSFSGFKTSVLYFQQKMEREHPGLIEKKLPDVCASIQYNIIEILMNKLKKAAKETGIKQVGIAGGVSANSGLRKALQDVGEELGWETYIPKFEYCTDNAAMIAMSGYFKYLNQEYADQGISPLARYKF